jgi:hypothetical protein
MGLKSYRIKTVCNSLRCDVIHFMRVFATANLRSEDTLLRDYRLFRYGIIQLKHSPRGRLQAGRPSSSGGAFIGRDSPTSRIGSLLRVMRRASQCLSSPKTPPSAGSISPSQCRSEMRPGFLGKPCPKRQLRTTLPLEAGPSLVLLHR